MRQRRGYPFMGSYLIALVCVAVGAFTATATGPSDAEIRHRQQCAPIEWRDDTDPQGWEMLIEQGYTGRADDSMEALYPPGCESAR